MTIGKGTKDPAGGEDASSGPGNVPVSPIEFRLDPASGVPTYLQLVHQVEHALRLGYLVPGDQLPKVRDVVAALAINPNTVSKAYREPVSYTHLDVYKRQPRCCRSASRDRWLR